LQWPTRFSKWREGKERGREKLLADTPPHAAGKHASHYSEAH